MITITEKKRMVEETYYEVQPKTLILYVVNEMCKNVNRVKVDILEIYKDDVNNSYSIWCGNSTERYNVNINQDTLQPIENSMYFFDMDKAIQVFKIRRKKFIENIFNKLDIDITKNIGELEKKALMWLKNELIDLERI